MNFLILLVCVINICLAADVLDSYNVDKNAISASGISSGAAFANNFHVVYSNAIMGMASFAGVPYWCAMALGIAQATVCMNTPGLVSVNTLILGTNTNAATGLIASTNNMVGSKVYIFHGTEDSTVKPGASGKINDYYEHFGADVSTDMNEEVGHGMPTVDYGVECRTSQNPYLNKCGFSGVFRALSHIYDGLVKPSSDQSLDGHFYEYDQREFLANPLVNNFDSDGGFVYVPSGCIDKTVACKLHVVFHGCAMGREFLDETFVRNAGYLEIGEVNNIIMLFPQISSSIVYGNPYGCWDWWGYEGIYIYATNTGFQVSTVKAMIDRVIG